MSVRLIFSQTVLLALAAVSGAHAQTTGPSSLNADPHLWLEDVLGDKPMAWVKQHNAVTVKELEAKPLFPVLQARLETILSSKERIPSVKKEGDFYYNFWRDSQHVRGIWRRTTLAQFLLPDTVWETVIDLDQLANIEKENWVWAGATCLYPKAERCLISLSRGGGDAKVVREYDVAGRTFVDDGFKLPEAKSSVSWIDQDSLFVSTDFGPGSMTSSGYPRIIKQWQRGTLLTQAQTVYEATAEDMRAIASKDFTPGHEYQFINRQINFYNSELFLRGEAGLKKVPKPDDATAFTVRDQLLITLRSDWKLNGTTYPQGALLATDFNSFMQGKQELEVLFAPTATSSLDTVTVTKSAVLVTELDKVKNRLTELRRVNGKWVRRNVDAPGLGTLVVSALDHVESEQYFLTVTDFLNPTTLYLATAQSDQRTKIKSLPAHFDAAPYKVEQFESTSKDGTKVPYFIIMNKTTKFDGTNPTLLYGYGGFEISLKPNYNAIVGEGWLNNGGVYVLANIRGGGEFGPRWHQAALKDHRQRAYDDFISVAQDLIKRKVTSPRHLGILGGSNGGLLVGAVMVQRPELFNAVVSQVPLLDMRRYNKLLAGASWMGEYGDPDIAEQWAYISKYSPYQNVFRAKKYPRVLFTTSTRDDRVHPGHARKMVAKMEEQGHDVLYWENVEGGHAGAANISQQALMWTLTYTFLLDQLH
ncbi:prolyl oligopeptidase family serine peptidase [Janthinobacterium lividum]|uniref:prolyl oligopeptidase family serine peptidase n=1 Tax=Janthinobacterium lividum TaxID=29581 RepID=UPI0014083C44|nr:prolyl oligopeptidase family serine peptidase [Janthinobacterium lividum]NHQ93867.1 S9 family peptidase [Janthinobacterium lividum]